MTLHTAYVISPYIINASLSSISRRNKINIHTYQDFPYSSANPIRRPIDDISDVPHFFRKKDEPLFFPTVISSWNVFLTVITSGNVFLTVIISRNVFSTVIISRNVFSTVISGGNVFPTVITSGNVFPTVSYKWRERVPDSYNKWEPVPDSYKWRERVPDSFNKQNVFSTVITSGNVFPTVITSRTMWNALRMYQNKQHVLRQQGGPTTKKEAKCFLERKKVKWLYLKTTIIMQQKK